MSRFSVSSFAACFVALTCVRIATAAAPSTAPTTAASDVEAREWVVFDVAVTQGTANDREAWPSSLPPFMTSRRGSATGADDNRPRPVGVIRLYGTLDSGTPTDVLLNLPNGETQTTWPRAQVKSNRILWSNLVPADDTTPAALDATHWLASLRNGDAAVVRSDRQTESFLLYDVSPKLSPPLRLRIENGKTLVENTGATPLHDLTLFKPGKDGQWSRASVTALIGREPPQRAAVTKPDAADAFDVPPTTQPATAPAATRPTTRLVATSRATTSPTTRPGQPSVAMAFEVVTAGSPDALLDPWRSKLLDAGVPKSDVDTVLRILAGRVTGDRWMTAVYRLDAAELDRLLPLEIVPTPRTLRRVGLVVVHGIDPAVIDEIDRLIVQCGDADFAKRRDATDQLIAIGKAAKAKLEKAQNHSDVEIAQRAEFILAAIETKKD